MSKVKEKDEFFMNEALKEAKKAFDNDEVPVGAVVVYKDKIIARAHNQIRTLNDPTAHAEMIAITSATSVLKDMRLLECTLYVTIEPCSMCAGALVLARVERIVYGADDPKTGACGSVLNIVQNKRLNHCIKVTKGVLKEECGEIIQEFFQLKRRIKLITSN